MSKTIFIAVAILMLFTLPVIAQVYVHNNWSGLNSSHHAWIIANDDARQDVYTAGAMINGTQDATVTPNTAYPYMGVDTTSFQVQAIAGAGYMEVFSQRLDSYSSYGPAGQTSYSYAFSSDSIAEITYHTWTNYASMKECQFGHPTTTGGRHFEASGSSWAMEHSINRNPQIIDPVTGGIAHAADTGVGKSASVWAWGTNGSGMIKLQGGQASGSQSFNLGHLPICGDSEAYDNNYAKFEGTGIGHLREDTSSSTGLSIHEGGFLVPGTPTDPAHYYVEYDYSGTFTHPDFGVKSQ